jgi:hypothetical protein
MRVRFGIAGQIKGEGGMLTGRYDNVLFSTSGAQASTRDEKIEISCLPLKTPTRHSIRKLLRRVSLCRTGNAHPFDRFISNKEAQGSGTASKNPGIRLRYKLEVVAQKLRLSPPLTLYTSVDFQGDSSPLK